MQPPYSYKGNLKGLLELFLTEHNKRVEKKKQFHIGNVTVKDNNDYISYSSSEYSVTLDAIQEKLMKRMAVTYRYDIHEKGKCWII